MLLILGGIWWEKIVGVVVEYCECVLRIVKFYIVYLRGRVDWGKMI